MAMTDEKLPLENELSDVLQLAGPTGVDPMVYWHALRRHWLLITGIGLLCVAIVGPAVWFGVGSRYTAYAHLRVAMEEDTVAFKTGTSWVNLDRFQIYKDTQLQLVESRFVLAKAISKPEISKIPEILHEEETGDPIEWLADELSVSFPGKSELMEVRLARPNPKEAADLVNAVVDAYMQEVVYAEITQKRKRLSKLEEVCSTRDAEMRKKRQELKNLAQHYGTSDKETLTLQQKLLLEELTLYRQEMAKTQFSIRQLQGELGAQEALFGNLNVMEVPAITIDELVRYDPVARQLSMELGFKKMDQVYTDSTVTPGVKNRYADRYHMEVQMLQEQYDTRVAELKEKALEKQRSEIQTDILRLKTMLAILEGQFKETERIVKTKREEADRFGNSTVDIEMLRADLMQLEALTAELNSEREKLRVETNSAARITLLERAEKPVVASNTISRIMFTLVAVLAAMCLPGVALVLWDVRAHRINTTDDVSKALRLPVLGSVPLIPSRVIRQLGSPSKRYQTWHVRLTESVDGIAARVLHKAEVGDCRAIMVSSATGGEGKTTLATQLALSLARSGRRTVLVDFDLRRPAFDEVFDLPLEPGVCELLRQQNVVADITHETSTSNLSVVTAGRWDRHALAALSNGDSAGMFEQLRKEFDFVVVDTSPILPVADARFVSQQVDTVVLSVFRDVSESPKIQAACDILAAFGVHSLEAVVTGSNDHLYGKLVGYESTISA